MIEITTIILILAIHFFADFICQSDEMAIQKSDSIAYLALHTLIYAGFFLVFGPVFFAITFLAHGFVDFFASRINKRLHEKGERHWFFVVIGFDQFIHVSGLMLTYYFLQ